MANGNGNGGHRLPPKQVAFVQEYLVDLNASAAYLRAGYVTNNANVNGPRLLANARIQEAIAKAQQERSERLVLTADDVLQRLAIESKGEGPDTSATARIRAAELTGKHLGMFVEKVETKDTTTQPRKVELVVVDPKT